MSYPIIPGVEVPVISDSDITTGTATTAGAVTAAKLKLAAETHAPDWDGDITDIDLDGGVDIGTELADADLILIDDGASGTNRTSALSRLWTWLQTKFGTGVATVLGTNVGSVGAVVVFGSALGTPSRGTLTNCAGLPATGVVNVGNPQTGTSYTLLEDDKNKLVTLSNANPVTVSVETATATWEAYDRVDLLNIGAGDVTVAGSGVTISTAADQSLVLETGKAATLIFLSDSTAYLVGGMAAA